MRSSYQHDAQTGEKATEVHNQVPVIAAGQTSITVVYNEGLMTGYPL